MHATFEGTLTQRDAKQHIGHTFIVPDDAAELNLRFVYRPERTPGGLNALHLTLFDPRGFRGAGHRRGAVDDGVVNHTIRLRAASATPGYLAGAIPAGEWTVVIDTHMILPEQPVTYHIVIETAGTPEVIDAPADPGTARAEAEGGPAWYCGDLHGHSIHSDAAWHITDLAAYAVEHRLDFVTLTDHNTISALAAFDALARSDLLTMGGIELTTYTGHALALGLRRWIDWRVQPGRRSMPQIAAEVAAAGGLFVIAHPMHIGDPYCTGCDWLYSDMRPGPARCIEVWNGHAWNSESHNERALALWYRWLNAGHRMVATAGTDIHGPLPSGATPAFNVVYAPALNEGAILGAIRQGHLYLSNGPQLELTTHSEHGPPVRMGDCLPDGSALIAASWDQTDSHDRIRLIADGTMVFEQPAGKQGTQHWNLAAGEARWVVLEVRDARDMLRAVTNPIFATRVDGGAP